MQLVLLLALGCGDTASSDPLADPSVDAHNAVREPLGLTPLAWDDELATVARDWAQHLADDEGCALIHDGTTGLGENLYWSSAPVSVGTAIEAWASEVAFYDYDQNACAPGEMCGHYTQIVWDDTARVGCAQIPCGDGGEVTMCSYDPPGNYIGEQPY